MQGSKKDFVWYELMTTDLAAAKQFYSAVVGWHLEASPMSPMPYLVANVGGPRCGVGGMMQLSPEMLANGMKPCWIGYIYADDVDAAAEAIRQDGGTVNREPADIPQIGRFAVVTDPQGAMFNLFKPQPPEGEMPTPPAPDATGNIGWRELMTSDWEKAWEFYSKHFGWVKDQAIDMQGHGVYQTFSTNDKKPRGRDMTGGMMTLAPFMKQPGMPPAFWNFYFNVADINAAKTAIEANGGTIANGPMQVPGGSWVINAIDPQGAMVNFTQPAA